MPSTENKPRTPTKLHAGYIFDLDGTIYLGDRLLPGAARMLAELRKRQIPIRFLSNNPTKDPSQYLTKLTALGVEAEIGEIANTVVTTVRWLTHHHPGAVLLVIGEEPLKNALNQAGFRLSDRAEEIDVVVASYDRTFNYAKLQTAFDAIWFHRRAILIQTNPDRYCPFPGGRGEPDCAAITAAIETCTGVKSVANLGKPSPIMAAEALSDLGLEPGECVMVGDRIATDIQMAKDTGMYSALVLTGESSAADVARLAANDQPSYVLDRIDQLIPAQIRAELGWTAQD